MAEMHQAAENIDGNARLAELFSAVPPHDHDAECATLSSLWLCGSDGAQFGKIRAVLWREAFFVPQHRIIFDILCGIVDAHQPLETPMLLAAVKSRGIASELPGDMLAAVLGAHFTSAQGIHYAQVVAEHGRKRESITLGLALAQRMNAVGDSRDILRSYIERLHRLLIHGKPVDVFTIREMLMDFMESKEKSPGNHVECGVPSLDEYRGIFEFGKYTVLAGRPSMGKSTAARWLLREFTRQHLAVGLIAVEESAHKIAGNYISAESGMENDDVAYKVWGKVEWDSAYAAVNQLGGLPWVGTDSAYSLDAITAAFEVMAIQHGCRVIAIDHLHLIQIGGRRDFGNREQELSQISERIKELAKKHKVACITAAQLSRPEKGRVPAPPAMTDLRGSGGIEEHADAVILLHREDYYHRQDNSYTPTRLCQWIIAKNRNAKVGVVVLKADLRCQRFAQYDPFQ